MLTKTHASNPYCRSEEFFNAVTHGIGVIFGIVALALLTTISVEQNDVWKLVSSILFGSSIIVMYLSSTLYHSFSQPKLKNIFKTLDHVTIYLLIAGTYTPLLLVNLREDWGWLLFSLIWAIALGGIIFKMFYINRFKRFSIILYLAMGWLAIIAIEPLYHNLAFAGLMWLVAGGLFYTAGTIFYLRKSVKYMHSIWHVFVIAGTACHFLMILNYVILA